MLDDPLLHFDIQPEAVDAQRDDAEQKPLDIAAEKLGTLAVKYKLNPAVVYPHSFRHRFAKNFLEKFNDISLLADLMGHESIETTRIYLRRTSTEQRSIVDKIVTW